MKDRTVVTNLMAREIVISLIEENADVRTAEDVADWLLKEKKNETVFLDGWEQSVDDVPYDWNVIENIIEDHQKGNGTI